MTPGTYYDHARTDLLTWAGVKAWRTLEIGCGTGANAEWLRAHGARWIEGVEPHSASARIAAGRFDLVHPAPIESALSEVGGSPFDLIICADVVEHLVDPSSVLKSLHASAARQTTLLISTPNIRHYRALARIAFGAGFRPEPEGVFDATHLHFFTRGNLRSLLMTSGWKPLRWGYPSYTRVGGTIRSVLGAATGGRTDEWLAGHWFVLAVPER